jgi:hypothetical protein
MARHLDWDRANKRELKTYNPRPGEEISTTAAKEDQEVLVRSAARRKKRTKYVRSTPQERSLRKLMEAPESVQERRLRTVLASLTGGKSHFQLTASDDGSQRLFQRTDVKLKVRIDPEIRRQLVVLSPGEPTSFGWITVSLAPGALEDRFADSLAAQLRELVSKQHKFQQRRNV